jgi:hypothetical protein
MVFSQDFNFGERVRGFEAIGMDGHPAAQLTGSLDFGAGLLAATYHHVAQADAEGHGAIRTGELLLA